MGGTELKYVHEAFDANWVSPAGPHIAGFEHDLAGYLGEGVSVAALSSGTAAIHLALIILGVKPIVYQGATPVFVDSESDTWNMDPELLKTAIKDRIVKTGKKPKAIILVHLYGMPAKLDEILAISREYEIPVIEDAAEALGSTYKGQKCGTFGDFGILSFNGNKIITTSGGGALVSKRADWIEKSRFLATQARDRAPHYQHSQIGYNYRLSNVSAAIGRGQMEVLDDRIKGRRAIFDHYKRLLGEDYASFLPEPVGSYANRWLTTARVNARGIQPETWRLSLEQHNIESRPLWKPMHLQPVFASAPAYLNGISESLFDRGICLPSGTQLSEQDIERVVFHLKSS
jgi:dTDP-4-amino-4,6-dideoxygalactose transaminase